MKEKTQKFSKYRVFISYSHKDQYWAKWLAKTIESYTVPKELIGQEGLFGPIPKKLSPVFWDVNDLEATHSLDNKIKKCLENTEILLVICSKNACESEWVNREIKYFKELGKQERILSVTVPDDKINDISLYFPPALLKNYNDEGKVIDGVLEPFSPYLSQDEDQLAQVRIKILAGISGLNLTEFSQREAIAERKRRTKARRIAFGLGALAIATTLFFISTFYLWKVSEKRRLSLASEILTSFVDETLINSTASGKNDNNKYKQASAALIRAWDISKNKKLIEKAAMISPWLPKAEYSFQHPISAFEYDHKSKLLVVGTADGEVLIFDENLSYSQKILDLSGYVRTIYFSPKNTFFVVATDNNEIVAVDISNLDKKNKLDSKYVYKSTVDFKKIDIESLINNGYDPIGVFQGSCHLLLSI